MPNDDLQVFGRKCVLTPVVCTYMRPRLCLGEGVRSVLTHLVASLSNFFGNARSVAVLFTSRWRSAW